MGCNPSAARIGAHTAFSTRYGAFTPSTQARYLTAGDLMQTGAVPLVSKPGAANIRSKPNSGAEYALVFDATRNICGVVTRVARHPDQHLGDEEQNESLRSHETDNCR